MKVLGVILLLVGLTISAQAQTDGEAEKKRADEEMRTVVESFGLGMTARVKVTLRNGVKMKGFIDRVGEDHFYLIRTDKKSTATVVAYSEIARIERVKNGIKWSNIAYRTGMGAGVVLGFLRHLRMSGPAIAPRFPRR